MAEQSLHFFAARDSVLLPKWLILLTSADDPNKKELLRITMSLREANKISQSLSKHIVSYDDNIICFTVRHHCSRLVESLYEFL